MNSLISNSSERMSSLQIAEITGKEHKNIMRDIRKLLESGVTQLNFELINYKDSKGREYPCYSLTKKGCLILASGYDAKLRESIIDRWEELEQAKQASSPQVPTSFKDALLLAAQQQEQLERQQQLITEQAPKVVFADAVAGSKRSCLVGELAKFITQNGYPIGSTRLFEWMRNNGYLCSSKGEKWNQPLQRYIEQGLFEMKINIVMRSTGQDQRTTTMVTGKGQIYFVNKFVKVPYL